MKRNIFCLALMSVLAVTAVQLAQAQEEPKFMRSSLYTFLIKSDAQNAKLDVETTSGNVGTELIKSFVKKDKDTEATGPRSQVAMEQFTNVPIPNQFNDHNLGVRVIDFDVLSQGISEDEANEAKQALTGKKESKGGKFFKGLGKSMLQDVTGSETGSALINIDTVSNLIPATVQRFFKQDNTAANLVAKWFDYNASADNKWGFGTITDRGLYNASAEEKALALKTGTDAMLAGKGFDLINKTFVLAINLKYRTNKAIMAEAQAMADAVGSQFGGIGMLATQAAGMAAGAIVGDGYSIQADTYLYQLVWDDNIANLIAENIVDKNASLEDLINLGICKLKPLGKEKSSARVRQSITNKRPESELVRIAVTEAVDQAIAKLQAKVEDFRTITPISKCDADGTIYAKIGTKEGCKKNDEYEILEPNEDEQGRLTYKKVGTVKVIDKKIWENRTDILNNLSDYSEEDIKADKIDKDAVALGATAFKGGKKGQDYTGYLIRLTKKK